MHPRQQLAVPAHVSSHHSWDVVDQSDLPSESNIIGTQWVFKVKYKNGEYDKHGSRIVVLGYRQRKGVDYYFETFIPTSSYVSIGFVLALTVFFLSGILRP